MAARGVMVKMAKNTHTTKPVEVTQADGSVRKVMQCTPDENNLVWTRFIQL